MDEKIQFKMTFFIVKDILKYLRLDTRPGVVRGIKMEKNLRKKTIFKAYNTP